MTTGLTHVTPDHQYHDPLPWFLQVNIKESIQRYPEIYRGIRRYTEVSKIIQGYPEILSSLQAKLVSVDIQRYPELYRDVWRYSVVYKQSLMCTHLALFAKYLT